MAETEESKDEDVTEDVDEPGFKPLTNFVPEVANPLKPLVDWTYGSVVLGRSRRTHDKLGLSGTVLIGAVCEKQKKGGSLYGYKIRMDIEFPHIMFLCGKRGSGKSYSLGIFAEELARLKAGLGTVVIDPIGTFWSLKNANKTPQEISALTHWGLEPQGLKNVLVYTPIGFYNEYKGIVDKPFSIAPADLTAEDWCTVFDVDRFKTQGLLIGDAIEKVKKGYTAKFNNQMIEVPPKPDRFSIGDIVQCIENDITITSRDKGYAQATRRSMIARFSAASQWGMFSTQGTPITELSVANVVTVIDVSHPKIGDAKRSLIVGIIARKILEARLAASRMEDSLAMGMQVAEMETIPVTWLLIDEVHLMLPHSGKTAASDALIEYAKLGRKPGCALILATQRPAATNDDILSQVDFLIEHTLALEDDIAAFRRRVPAALPQELGSSDFIRSMPVGIALLADQKTQKRTMLAQLRPRLTHHAGRAAAPAKKAEGADESDDSADTGISGLPSASTGPSELPAHLRSHETDPEFVMAEPLEPTFSLTDLLEPAAAQPETVPEPPVAGKVRAKPKEKPIAGSRKPGVSSIVKEPAVVSKPGIGVFQQDGVEYTPKAPDLQEGGLVLIRSRSSEAPFEFYKAVAKNFRSPPLSISRTHPKKLSQYFDKAVQEAEMFWLSKEAGNYNIGPTNLEKLAHQLNRHMKSSGETEIEESKKSIAILEGVEYLVSNNDFNKVLRFIEALHEKILLNKALGILPINPSAMDEREIEMLEREMDMCLTYQPGRGVSITGGTEEDESEDEEPGAESREPGDESPSLTAFKRSLVKASERKLKNACRKLGIKATGDRDELYQRIIDYVDKNKPPIRMKGIDEPEVVVSGEEAKKIKEIEGQYKKLEKEREKLRTEHEKLLKEKLKHTHELEMTKIKAEKNELLKIKKELTEREKKLLTREKDFEKRVVDLEERFEELETALPGDESLSRKDFGEVGIIDATARKMAEKPIGPPTILPRLQHDELLQKINRYIDKSLFGKKKEEVTSIQPVFLQIHKTRLRVPGGRFRKKDREYDVLWDTVSGELVIDYRNGLKRSEGLELFYTLSQPQIKILLAMGSLRAHEQLDLMKETGLAKSHTTRALNKLVDMGIIERKFDSEGKNEKFKRVYKMKIPSHPEKEKVVLPEQVPRDNKEMILPASFYDKQINKLLEGLIPGARVVKSENIFYPFFMVDILGKGKEQRKLIIDAVTGREDKILSKALS